MATMIKINSQLLHSALDGYNVEHGTTTTDLARKMGRADSYLFTIMNRGTIPTSTMTMLSALFGIKPEAYVWTKEDEEPEEEIPEEPEWDYRYEVLADKGCVKAYICHYGEIAAYAFARIKIPQTPVTIAQAISYAAHMCYKKLEQEELEAL